MKIYVYEYIGEDNRGYVARSDVPIFSFNPKLAKMDINNGTTINLVGEIDIKTKTINGGE